MANDDGDGPRAGYQGLYIEDDPSIIRQCVRTNNIATEMYVMKAIPDGYKATHVKVYASSTVINGVTAYLLDHTSGVVTSKGTGNTGVLIDITDISSSSTDNISIRVAPASVTVLIYGADITIALI